MLELDAESGPTRHSQFAVSEGELLSQQTADERRVRDRVFGERRAVERRDEVERGRNADAAREAVRDDLDAALVRQGGDLPRDRAAATAGEIGLEHIDVTLLDEGSERSDARICSPAAMRTD